MGTPTTAMMVTELEAELKAYIQASTTDLENSVFSIFDIEDASRITDNQRSLPAAFVAFDGVSPSSNSRPGVTSENPISNSVISVDAQFVVVFAVTADYNERGVSNKAGYEYLDKARKAIYGRVGVSRRPWRFLGERPEPEASGDGILYYSQVWQTTVLLQSEV
jgi:hypothetical protein